MSNAISGQNGTPKQLQICPSKISMAPMSVDWENTVLETTQNPVGGIILLLIFFFYIFNPVSAYLRNVYLIHDKNLPHSNIKNKRMKSIELMNK